MKQIIIQKLSEIKPIKLEITDETSSHANHLEKDAKETHFKIIIISDHFQNLSKIERHKIIHNLLRNELSTQIHALSLKLLTKKESEKLI